MKFSDYHADLSEDEFEEASNYYKEIRQDDGRLFEVEAEAVRRVKELTGYHAIDVGSFGLGLNLEGSDIDIAIGVPLNDLERVVNVLTKVLDFKGLRRTSPSSNRHVFGFVVHGVDIDVGVLPESDFRILAASLDDYHREMTEKEKIIHVWHKKQLKEIGEKDAYAHLKLYPYSRFCSSFEWVPIRDD